MNLIKKQVLAVLAIGSTFAATQASAALPALVGTTITGISDNVQAVFDLAFPVVALGLGLAIVIKLFKRFSNKI